MNQHPQTPTNPYDFIVNDNHKAKKPRLPGGNSKQGRILIAVFSLLGLILIGSIVAALLLSAGNAGKANLTKAAQQQNEIIRISKLGMEHARDPSTQNLAITANMSLLSDQ